MKFNLKMVVRGGRYLLYLKSSEEISDMIKMFEASNALFYFEDIRIYRDHKNMTNRLNNMEQANIEKIINTSNEQIKDIEIIDKYLGIGRLDTDLYILAKLRLENPEDSLRELSLKYNEKTEKNYTKSGINHLFIKIKNIANSYKKQR